MRIGAIIGVFSLAGQTCIYGQTPADVMQKARSAIVMLDTDIDGAAGLIVGNDSGAIYIAGAAHMLSSCTPPFPAVNVSFDGVTAKKAGAVQQCDSAAGVDTLLLTVARDADTDALLLRFDPNLLASDLPPAETPVHSVGHSSFAPWFLGSHETLLPPEGATMRFRSDAEAGQSGGGLFNEAWELLGTPLRTLDGTGIFTARPIQPLLDLLAGKWSVPLTLKPRPRDQRMLGADEIARLRAADSLGERAAEALIANDVLGATTYVLEGRRYADTSKLKATALTIPEPALTLQYASFPDGRKNGYTAIAVNDMTHMLAVGASDGSVRLLKVEDGSLVRNLPALQVPIASLAFSDDGGMLVAGVQTSAAQPNVGVAVWKTDGSSPASWVAVQNTFGGTVAGVQVLSPTRIAGVIGNSGMLFLIDPSTGTELWHQRKNLSGAQSLQRISDTEFLVRGNTSHTLVSFANDAFTTQTVPGCQTHDGLPLQRATYGRAALTASNPPILARACDDEVFLSDITGGSTHPAGHHTAPISQIVPLDAFGAIISGGWDGVVRVWNATSGVELAESGLHRGGIRGILAADGGKAIVVLEQDRQRFDDGGGVRVWAYRPESVVEVEVVSPPVPGIPPHPPPGVLQAALPPRPSATCWRAGGSTNELTATNQPNAMVVVTEDCSFGVVFSSDHVHLFRNSRGGGGTWSAIGDVPANGLTRGLLARDVGVVFWTEESNTPGAPDRQTRAFVWAPPAAPVKIVDEPGVVFSGAVSDDGKLVALSMLTEHGSQGPIRAWDWQANKQIFKRDNPLGVPGDMAFEKDGSLFVSTGVSVELWNPTASAPFSGDTEFALISHLYLSPDGSTLAVTALAPGERIPRHLFLFDVAQRKLESDVRLPRVPMDLEFSPDGRRLRVEYQKGAQYFGVVKTDRPESQEALTGERLSDDGEITASP
jgi:WD40 repeat protein